MTRDSAGRGGAVYGDNSPIAAFATTPGNSALTLIRCSGAGSIEMFSAVFTPPGIMEAPGNTVIHGWIVSAENKEKIDEVLVSVFRAPKSYTGEDSIDISCHGGLAAGKAVTRALKSAGFRDALPGEFTFRAFMNGKLDLAKSESVMELVSAKTDKGRRGALSRLSGSLSRELDEIKTALVRVLAGAEIYLDYSEDEVSAEISDEIAGRLPDKDVAIAALKRLKNLLASWPMERLLKEGVTVVIAGSPNAGKSSLFNAFLKEDRSIVTENPGTTRDWIEAWISIEGIPVRLVDTAGLRESEDSAEKIGVQRSLDLIGEALLVLYLIDGARGITEDDKKFLSQMEKTVPRFILWNKADIAAPPRADIVLLSVSAKTGEGVTELTKEIARFFEKAAGQSSLGILEPLSAASPDVSLGTERQKGLVEAAVCSLDEALALADQEKPLDIIAPLIREVVNSLGEITGEVSTADILEEMFSHFCVGK